MEDMVSIKKSNKLTERIKLFWLTLINKAVTFYYFSNIVLLSSRNPCKVLLAIESLFIHFFFFAELFIRNSDIASVNETKKQKTQRETRRDSRWNGPLSTSTSIFLFQRKGGIFTHLPSKFIRGWQFTS